VHGLFLFDNAVHEDSEKEAAVHRDQSPTRDVAGGAHPHPRPGEGDQGLGFFRAAAESFCLCPHISAAAAA